jgi:FtsP/CotA-like multicopper oxidase with cupredoxin domain
MKSESSVAPSVGLMLVFVVAVSYAQDAKTDYNYTANFGQYNTYSSKKVQTNDQVPGGRIRAEANYAIAAKGWSLIPSGVGSDVSADEATQNRQTLGWFDNGFGAGRRWEGFAGGFGEAATSVDIYKARNFVNDLVDSKTEKFIERSSLSDTPSSRANMLLYSGAAAQIATSASLATPVPPVAKPCPRRFKEGKVVHNPPSLFSSNGVLTVRFSYEHSVDSDDMELLCFMTPEGLQDPTLHLKPGDHLVITITNNTPSTPAFMPLLDPPNCGNPQPTQSSVNIHYHGTNISPACHQDNVVRTVINSGESFQYDVAFPSNEPSGLYWYHPHIHMLAEHDVQAGATGAIIVEGIENQQPAVSGLKERILVVRDQPVPGAPTAVGNIPSFDLTLNYTTITSPTSPDSSDFVPPILKMHSKETEFWRISNSAADVNLDIQYVFDGVPQTMKLVALDGVPVNSQDGTQPGGLIEITHFLLPTASRMEVIVGGPPSSVKLAQLITRRVYSGPGGLYNNPQRPLLTVQSVGNGNGDDDDNDNIPTSTGMSTTQQRFSGLGSAPVAVERTVFFNENVTVTPPQFFMDVQGKPEHLFDPNDPPDVIATQGTVEEWTVENHTAEIHEFHIHQIHFLVESQNNFELNGSEQEVVDNGQYLDTIQVPFWDQNPDHPFPSVTLRMDFRGRDVGDFVFHCHILSHEDLGMMNIIRVQPRPSPPNPGDEEQ